MSALKRFTETDKWDDPWFIRLSWSKKLLWLYICDRCDRSGVIDFCPELVAVQIGAEVTEESLNDFGDRVQKLPSGKWQIVKFLPFQYGTVDANCPAHKPVIRLIRSNNLKYPINNLSDRVSNTPKDKERDKEEDKKKTKKGDNLSLVRVRSLFNKRPDTPLDDSERRAWEKANPAVEATDEAEWQLLEWAYQQKTGNAHQFRRHDMATLLNNWNTEIDRARGWKQQASRTPKVRMLN